MSEVGDSEAQAKPALAELQKKACPKCGRRYRVPYLYSHMREAHGLYGGATGIKRGLGKLLTCDLCDRSFETKHGLITHVTKKHRGPQAEPVPVPSAALVPVMNGHRPPQGQQAITVVANMQVVTDGDRIGIVEWHDS